MKKWAIFYLLFSIVFVCKSVSGQEKNFFSKRSSGVELGSWKPNYLRTSETPFAFSFSKENLYLGLFLLTPLKKNLSLRVTIGYYNYTENNSINHQKSIVLIPILFDIKYMLVSESKISPYVSYGIGTCIGHQTKLKTISSDSDKYKIGYGINFGTGFDFLILKHLALGLEFRYHYVKFSKVFIFTDDYSGPKINLTVYYLF